jgi:hypothetical protein
MRVAEPHWSAVSQRLAPLGMPEFEGLAFYVYPGAVPNVGDTAFCEKLGCELVVEKVVRSKVDMCAVHFTNVYPSLERDLTDEDIAAAIAVAARVAGETS